MIKAVIFDCFGVLYRDNLSLLYDAVPENQHQALRDIIHATDLGMLTRDEYYNRIAELAGGDVPLDVRAIELRQHVRDDVMVAYSQTFRSNYKVGLLSNIDSGTIRQLFPNHEELFDVFVASGDLGTAKPDERIFTYAAEQLGLPPDQCVMIDDIARNVDGARFAGMHGILFTNRQNLDQELKRLGVLPGA